MNETVAAKRKFLQEIDRPAKMSWREALKLGKNLSKDIFRKKVAYKDIEAVEEALYMKAQLAHVVVMLGRVVYPLMGLAYWQKAYEKLDEREDINLEFVKSSESIVKIAVVTMIVLGVLLDMLVWRARKFANLILYYEMFGVLIQGFVPYDLG